MGAHRKTISSLEFFPCIRNLFGEGEGRRVSAEGDKLKTFLPHASTSLCGTSRMHIQITTETNRKPRFPDACIFLNLIQFIKARKSFAGLIKNLSTISQGPFLPFPLHYSNLINNISHLFDIMSNSGLLKNCYSFGTVMLSWTLIIFGKVPFPVRK